MFRLTALFFFVALCAQILIYQIPAHAVPIAIIDSGTDLKHDALKNNVWVNPKEPVVDHRDNDWNGKYDDINGWNFANNNNQVIDYSYLGTFSPDCKKFFELQLKYFKGTITEEEIQWLRQKTNDESFISELMKFGNFIHGTHVAGIAAENAPQAKIMAVKLIATEVKKSVMKTIGKDLETNPDIKKGGAAKDKMLDYLIRLGIQKLAMAQAGMLKDVGLFVWFHKMQVANASFGTSTTQLKAIFKMLLSKIYKREATDEEATKYATYMMQLVVENGRQFAVDAKDTFFVVAAGNDGTNNDEMPTYPASVQRSNMISVAATYGHSKLASFSNYGIETVEVAAPGVGINSSIPGNDYMTVSGTSQAAPFVTNVVGRMLDANPALTHDEIKEVLKGTVDYKDFLKDKVASSGIVNADRAILASAYLMKMTMKDALIESRLAIADVSDDDEPIPGLDAGTLLRNPEAFVY